MHNSYTKLIQSILILLLIHVSLTSVNADDSIDTKRVVDDYNNLLECRYDDNMITIPATGVRWSRDTAEWILHSGNIRFMAPLSDGSITGFVFEGRGEFILSIPDQREIEQLRRFSGDEELVEFKDTFKSMVVRFSEPLLTELVPPRGNRNYSPNKLAKKQQDHWLKDAFFDSNVRLMSALCNPDNSYFLADMKTKSYDWIRFEIDSQRHEEIHIMKLQRTNNFLEVWVSLDRKEDRLENGRPGPQQETHWDIIHADISVDVTKKSDKQRRGWSRTKPRSAVFSVTVTVKPLIDNLRSILLYLHPLAEVTDVRTQEGNNLHYIRHHLGAHFSSLRKEIFDSSLLVLFPTGVRKDKDVVLTIDYERDILNYASGRFWYPAIKYNINDLHTAKLCVTLPDNYELKAVGSLQEEKIHSDSTKTCIWKTDEVVKSVGFSFGKGFSEEHVSVDDHLEIISFGKKISFTSGDIVHKVAVDVAKSIDFFQKLFGQKLPFSILYATSITSQHGQAFHGFLHLSEYTYMSEHPGASELFRAHEAAHQFWGLLVSFESYRDQWLSEALAEYSAMMFIEATMTDEDFFTEIVSVYSAELRGSFRGALSKFARPWNIKFHPAERKRIGPIGVGFRASPAEVPQAFFIQSYHKGALVIHMLRMLLQQEYGNDDMFESILRDFVQTYKGQSATTDNFLSIIEKNTGQEWAWFFNQWIYDTVIPTYKCGWSLSETDSSNLEFTVEQSEVPSTFKMTLPVRVLFEDGLYKDFSLLLDENHKKYSFTVAEKPGKVIFNYNNAVLATIINR